MTRLSKAATVLFGVMILSTAVGQDRGSAGDGPQSILAGRWTMEDAFTLHLAGEPRIESHPRGMFTLDLELLPDGEGILGGQRFQWRQDGDTLLWTFGESFVRVLPRPVTEDVVLLLALEGGTLQNGGAISVLRRREPRL